MNIEIFYFSGTGNSLYIVKEIRKRIPGTKIIPVISALKNNKLETNAGIVGFVFPVHAHSIPLHLRLFLKKLEIKSASYLFAVSSRFGTSRIFKKINRLLKKGNRKIDASFGIQMPETFIPILNTDSDETIAKLESGCRESIDEIVDTVINQKQRKITDSVLIKIITIIISPVVEFIFQKTRYFNLENKFYPDEKCCGCGVCAHICLTGKIIMSAKKPVWQKNIGCSFCFACIHYCPLHSIQIKNTKTSNRGRYHHPKITAEEIAGQKFYI